MLVQQIRNATVKIVYQNKTILIDPWLAPQYAIGSFAQMIPNAFKLQDKMKANIPMPIAPLPMSVEDILRDVDAIIITHIHPDHVDMMPNGHIGECLPHHLPVFVQNDEDVACVAATLPEAHLIISHMDTVAHASISRYEMKGLLTKRQIANFIIPEDGESLSF